MTYQFPPDVEKLIQSHLSSGAFESTDDVLREALRVLGDPAHAAELAEAEYHETVAAIRDGIADMEAGRMRPLRAIISETDRPLSHGK